MADFDPPFGNAAERRFPTAVEQDSGFPCGPADQQLFNGLFHRLEAEIGEVISHAGLVPTDADLTQLRQAIEALIAAATGGGDPATYLLLSQAVARLPVFPEFSTADGKVNVSSPASGTVRLPGGITFIHRGIKPIVTAETDFLTDISKIYHLRWSPTGGYTLNDLANGVYNPGALAENDASFDTTYDNMLIARVVTNSSNVATITNLVNRPRMTAQMERAATVGDAGALGVNAVYSFNLSRKPMAMLESTWAPGGNRDSDLRVQVTALDRYGATVNSWNWTNDLPSGSTAHNSPGYRYNVLAV